MRDKGKMLPLWLSVGKVPYWALKTIGWKEYLDESLKPYPHQTCEPRPNDSFTALKRKRRSMTPAPGER